MIDTSLSDYAAVDTASRGASLALANTERASPLRSEEASAKIPRKKFVLMCPFGGGLGLFICTLCIKSGRDYRRIFCPLGLL